MKILDAYSGQILSAFRIMTGLLFLQHGTTKYLSFPVTKMSNISPMTMGGAAGIFELVGGCLIVLGFFTRPVAFLLSGVMAVAYFYAHALRGFFPILNGGELAIMYCFAFFYLSSVGGGAWSVDQMRAKST